MLDKLIVQYTWKIYIFVHIVLTFQIKCLKVSGPCVLFLSSDVLHKQITCYNRVAELKRGTFLWTMQCMLYFGEQGKKGIYFRGTWEIRPNFEGKRGTGTILGNRELKNTFFMLGEQENKKTHFSIFVEDGNIPIFQEKGTGTPWEGLNFQFCCIGILERNISLLNK